MNLRRRAHLVAVVATPLLALAACNGSNSSSGGFGGFTGGSDSGGSRSTSATGGPAAGERTTSETSTASLGADGDASELSGVWTGNYVCNQGPTKMTLTLSGSGSHVEGVFQFAPQTSSADAGSYTVAGELQDGKLDLRGKQWVKQPTGYLMVDFEVTTISRSMLRGDVDGDGCTTFQVTR